MPRGYLVGVAGLDGDHRPVQHVDLEASGYRVSDVTMLAGTCAYYGFDVLRPSPTWLKYKTADGHLVESDDVHLAGRELANLIGRLEAFSLQAWHSRLSYRPSLWPAISAFQRPQLKKSPKLRSYESGAHLTLDLTPGFKLGLP